jgi:carboxymethylenebutenolidase
VIRAAGRLSRLLLLSVVLGSAGPAVAEGQAMAGPDTVVVHNGSITLRALLWRPAGRGPFPAVLFNHGSGPTLEPFKPTALGPMFARHGYEFLFLFRRGSGLSTDQGRSSADLMDQELAANGQEARNRLLLRLLEDDQLSDVLAGVAFLRGLAEVDVRRLAVVGHSFGGMLSLLATERDGALRAAVEFGGAANSWEGSPALRERLLAAVGHTKAPVFFIHASNDYSVAPARAMATEMARLGKPHRIKIYPAVGRTAAEGHDFVYLGVATWEPDVFAFLDERMRP